ncbi:MAG: DUF885 family protein, partial [Rudaea sp.]
MNKWAAGLAGAAFAIFAPAWADAPPAGSATETFQKIYGAEWKWRQQQFPGVNSEDRESGAGDLRLPAVDAKTQSARLAYWDDVLKQLSAVKSAELSPEDQINFAVFRPQIENLASGVRLRDYEMPFNSDSQFWSDLTFMANRPFKNEKAARAYIARLDDVPRFFDEQIANMRAGLKRGFSVPRAVLDGRDVSISTIAEVKGAADSVFFKPFVQLPATLPVDEQAKLRADAERAIREHVLPAYSRLLRFFREEYVPQARTTLAAEALPDGKAYYRQQIREYTTLDLAPEAIHQIGLKEVARIDAQMRETMRATGFKG